MSEKLKVALVQTVLAWEKPVINRNTIEKKINASTEEVDLLILPEMFTTGFTMKPENMDPSQGKDTLSWMQRVAQNKNTAVMGSLPFIENGSYTNRLFFVTPDGHYQHYDKRHTFTLAGEDQVYTSGTERLVVSYKGFKICPMICYDLRFPVWARNTEAYDVLIYVANWPKPRIAAWDTLLKARAIENMAYCIGVNRIGTDENGLEYSGHSAVYDTLGEQCVFSQKEEVVYAVLEKEHITTTRNKLKFLDDQDTFILKV